jgi:fructoselysine-6-P-deglycase FrlB-like protein
MARVNELMWREMQAQPDDLAAALPELRRQAMSLSSLSPERVLLTGSGDSLFAALSLEMAYGLELGRPVWAMPSAAAARYGSGRLGGLTIVISVSGEVRRTIEAAMSAHIAGGKVLAVTSGAESALAREADAVIVMPQPITRATPHTRDYTMTLLALLTALEGLSGRPIAELDAWPGSVRKILDEAATWADGLAATHAATQAPVWFLGMGPDRGTAEYGALKFWEAGGSAAWWDDLEEFGHGSQLAARPGELAVLFACGSAAGRAHEMREGIERMGLAPQLIGDGAGPHGGFQTPAIRPELTPLYTSIPPQALAYAFATARGIDVELPLGGDPLGDIYDDVHRDWMRNSRLEPLSAE